MRRIRNYWRIWVPVLAATVIAAAGYLGYLTSRAGSVPPVEAPPTVPVERGEVLLSVTAPGTLVSSGQAAVLSLVAGSLDQILAQPGDVVTAGQVLAKIGDRAKFETAVSNAEAEWVKAQAALDEANPDALISQARIDLLKAQKQYESSKNKRLSLEYGRSSQANIDVAQANYILAEAAVSHAEDQYNGFSAMPDSDPGRAQALSLLGQARARRDTALANFNWLLSRPDANEVGQADAQVALDKAKVDSAQAKLDRMEKGDFPERDQAEANLKKARSALDQAREDLDHLEVKAPFAGVVVDVKGVAGQAVTSGMELFKMIDPHQVEVFATVVEEDLQMVKTGQSAQLYFDALPELNLTGHLARIVPQRTSDSHVLYPVYITLDEVPDRLAPGMTVDASITISKKEDVLRLPRTLVHARSDGTAELSVWDGAQVVKRLVTVGLRGDSYVEILSGVEEGDEVVSR